MITWNITITETYSRTFSIEANSMAEAEKMVNAKYDKKEIKLSGANLRCVEITGQRESICPVCGSDHLEYADHNIEDEGGAFPWVCLNCGAQGEEVYLRKFIGHADVEGGNPDEAL